MPDGYHAPTAAILKCGTEIGGKAQEVSSIKEKVANAEVPNLAWGILGAATTYSSYKDMLEKFKSHMEQISKAIGNAEQAFTETGKHYQETDKQVAGHLEKLKAQMDTGV